MEKKQPRFGKGQAESLASSLGVEDVPARRQAIEESSCGDAVSWEDEYYDAECLSSDLGLFDSKEKYDISESAAKVSDFVIEEGLVADEEEEDDDEMGFGFLDSYDDSAVKPDVKKKSAPSPVRESAARRSREVHGVIEKPSAAFKASSYSPPSPAYSPTSPICSQQAASFIEITSPASRYKSMSPSYSPTSQAYSPTSPSYSPVSASCEEIDPHDVAIFRRKTRRSSAEDYLQKDPPSVSAESLFKPQEFSVTVGSAVSSADSESTFDTAPLKSRSSVYQQAPGSSLFGGSRSPLLEPGGLGQSGKVPQTSSGFGADAGFSFGREPPSQPQEQSSFRKASSSNAWGDEGGSGSFDATPPASVSFGQQQSTGLNVGFGSMSPHRPPPQQFGMGYGAASAGAVSGASGLFGSAPVPQQQQQQRQQSPASFGPFSFGGPGMSPPRASLPQQFNTAFGGGGGGGGGLFGSAPVPQQQQQQSPMNFGQQQSTGVPFIFGGPSMSPHRASLPQQFGTGFGGTTTGGGGLLGSLSVPQQQQQPQKQSSVSFGEQQSTGFGRSAMPPPPPPPPQQLGMPPGGLFASNALHTSVFGAAPKDSGVIREGFFGSKPTGRGEFSFGSRSPPPPPPGSAMQQESRPDVEKSDAPREHHFIGAAASAASEPITAPSGRFGGFLAAFGDSSRDAPPPVSSRSIQLQSQKMEEVFDMNGRSSPTPVEPIKDTPPPSPPPKTTLAKNMLKLSVMRADRKKGSDRGGKPEETGENVEKIMYDQQQKMVEGEKGKPVSKLSKERDIRQRAGAISWRKESSPVSFRKAFKEEGGEKQKEDEEEVEFKL